MEHEDDETWRRWCICQNTAGVGKEMGRTGLGGEDVLVVEEVLHPGHHVVDVGGCGELDALAVLVDPCVVEATSFGQSVREEYHMDTHLGPADMVGHDCAVQHSARTP